MAARRKRDLQELLLFLKIPFELVSDDKEILLDTCIFCGKNQHLYINKESSTWICHHCGEAGAPPQLERAVLGAVVYRSWPNEEAESYWSSRGLDNITISDARLGYYPPLGYTIPYFQGDEITNIRFRTEGDGAKYLGLPGYKSDGYFVGSDTADLVVLTEGEVDALSVYQAMGGDVLAVGLPGAGHITDALLGLLPSQARIVAVVDNDAPGKRAATKLKSKIPGVRIAIPVGHKDINEVLVAEGPEAVRALLQSAGIVGSSGGTGEEDNGGRGEGVRSSIYINLPDEAGDWLIEDLWMERALGFIAGIPKAMKSILALHLGYHIAEGKSFATKKVLKQGPVLLFQEEDNDHIIKRRLRAINAGRGSDNFWVYTPGTTEQHLRLDDDRALERLDEAIVQVQPVLVILDPLANMHALEDENNAGPMNKMLERLRHIRDLRKCSFMIVHHMGKEGEVARGPGQRMRGSSVLHAKSESSLYVERHGKLLRITVENKLAPERTLEVQYGNKEFEYVDEYGAIIDDGKEEA